MMNMPVVDATRRVRLVKPATGRGAGAPSESLPATLRSGCIDIARSEEHTSELQSLMRISYAVFCLKKKKITKHIQYRYTSKHKITIQLNEQSCIMSDTTMYNTTQI